MRADGSPILGIGGGDLTLEGGVGSVDGGSVECGVGSVGGGLVKPNNFTIKISFQSIDIFKSLTGHLLQILHESDSQTC